MIRRNQNDDICIIHSFTHFSTRSFILNRTFSSLMIISPKSCKVFRKSSNFLISTAITLDASKKTRIQYFMLSVTSIRKTNFFYFFLKWFMISRVHFFFLIFCILKSSEFCRTIAITKYNAFDFYFSLSHSCHIFFSNCSSRLDFFLFFFICFIQIVDIFLKTLNDRVYKIEFAWIQRLLKNFYAQFF